MRTSKKAVVGKAADLIILVLISFLGFFLVNTFFLGTASSGDDVLECYMFNWKNSGELITTLNEPVDIGEGNIVPLYLLLTNEDRSYDEHIEAKFNELYGERNWYLGIEGLNTLNVNGLYKPKKFHEENYNTHIVGFLCSSTHTWTREEKLTLFELSENPITIEIQYEVDNR